MATPWLKAAIEENSAVSIPSLSAVRRSNATKGRTSLRLRDIVVRDADGTVVASAPKAEVGIPVSVCSPEACGRKPQSGWCRIGGADRNRRSRHGPPVLRIVHRRGTADREPARPPEPATA